MKRKDIDSGDCLVCGTTPIQSRGLCARHHSRFHREMRDLTEEQKKTYEATLIERGLLLPPKPPGRQVKKDPFRDVAAELFVAETEQNFTSKRARKKTSGAKKKAKKTAAKKRATGPKKKSASRKKKK